MASPSPAPALRDLPITTATLIYPSRISCIPTARIGIDTLNPAKPKKPSPAAWLKSLEQLILKEGPDTIAAMIGEPIMGAGGVILPPATYWEKVQAVLKKYDVMLIADEVICGFGRTGNMWGATTFGMKPDMITCAKALSSGYLPIGAVLISSNIYDALAKQSEKIGIFSHGFTYSGHPVTSAVALETLKIYEERDILSHVRKMAPLMQAGLRRFADHPLVGEVRGIGLIGAIELVADKAKRTAFDPSAGVGAFLAKRAHHHGVIIRPLGDSIAFCPPLIIKESEIDLMFERFGRALDDATAMVRERGLAKIA